VPKQALHGTKKFALCRESFEEHMEQTSIKMNLVNSLTATDPPLRKLIDYTTYEGRQSSGHLSLLKPTLSPSAQTEGSNSCWF
jgi:hypothetical protein